MSAEILQFEKDFVPFTAIPAKWRTIHDESTTAAKFHAMVDICRENDVYRHLFTDLWAEKMLWPAAEANRCRILETPKGTMFYTWIRAEQMPLIALMAGEDAQPEDWYSENGMLWLSDLVATPDHKAAQAVRTVSQSMFLTGVGDLTERVLYKRGYLKKDSRIGWFTLSLRGAR